MIYYTNHLIISLILINENQNTSFASHSYIFKKLPSVFPENCVSTLENLPLTHKRNAQLFISYLNQRRINLYTIFRIPTAIPHGAFNT